MPRSFFDTSVLLHVASADAAKAERVEKLIAAGGAISVQVLNEITHVARRTMGLSWVETRAFLSTIQALMPARPVTVEIHETGIALAERHGLSTADAMIIASALHANCDTVWSEDMQDGMKIGKQLRVINPFKKAR